MKPMIELSSSIVAVEAKKPYPPRDRSLPSSLQLPGYERREKERNTVPPLTIATLTTAAYFFWILQTFDRLVRSENSCSLMIYFFFDEEPTFPRTGMVQELNHLLLFDDDLSVKKFPISMTFNFELSNAFYRRIIKYLVFYLSLLAVRAICPDLNKI